jgi:RNA polymerase sigma-70 factor, ECF subfamily
MNATQHTTLPLLPADEALMLQVLKKDKVAFQQLVKRWKNPLVNYFYRQLRDQEVSEDLTQEVFIRVWKADKYEAKAKFSTWLYRLAYHLLVDHYRKQKRQPPQEPEVLLETEPATAISPESQTLLKDQQAQIEGALRKLPAAQQNILILSKFQDLKYSQIAEILNCPANRVKVNVFRALKNLTHILKEEKVDDGSF